MFRLFRGKREALKKYLLAAFLAVMALGMVGVVTPFFSGGDSGKTDSRTLAEIGGTTITVQDLQRNLESRFRNSPFGNDPRLVATLARPQLDEMVAQVALRSQARKLGIEVTDQEFFRTLQGIPWLYPDGNFVGADKAAELIQQQTGMTEGQFNEQLRESLLMEKMRSVVTDGVLVSASEVRGEFVRRNAKAKIEYVLFDPSQFLKSVELTPQALEAFFNKSPDRYKLPEQRRVRYALIDADSVRAQVRVGEDEVRRQYTERLADYRVPERVRVAHILFKTTGKTPAEVATIEKTAREVLGQVRSGTDFAELAKKYSEDSSASNGGEIGWIVRGQTVKEFESAAFTKKAGQIGDLIKTVYGIHILKVIEKQDAHLQTFEEVKDTLRGSLEKEKLEAAEQALAEKLERAVGANSQRFDEVMKKAGLEVKQTPLFRYKQTIPDFGNSEGFANLAFQLRPGDSPNHLALPKGLAILQVVEIVPEHVAKLEEVRDRVEEDYRAEKSKEIAAEKARGFALMAKNGDFRKAAKTAALTVKDSKDFTEQDYIEGLGSGSQLPEAFTLAPGQTSDVVSVGGNSAVFRVVSHTAPDPADLARQQDRIGEELVERKRSLAFEVYKKNLKEELLRSRELKLNEAAMKQFLAAHKTQ